MIAMYSPIFNVGAIIVWVEIIVFLLRLNG